MQENRLNGAITAMAFLMFILIAFGCINMYKHYSTGRWSKGSKIIDFAGLIMLLATFGGMVLPMLKR